MTTRTKLFMAMIVVLTSIATTYSVAIAQTSSGHDFPVQALAPTANCLVPKVDGERVPFPLQKANTKFDLSEGETYLLNGTLVSIDGKVYLHVDFNSQPWLATAKMTAFPYLQVNLNAGLVAHYAGRMIQVAVVAHENQNNQVENEKVVLSSFLTPEVL